MTWQPPLKNFLKYPIPEEIRARMKEGDKLLCGRHNGQMEWNLNGMLQSGVFDEDGNKLRDGNTGYPHWPVKS